MARESRSGAVSDGARNGVHREILEQLIAASSEPLLVARTNRPEWPVVLCNAAFTTLSGDLYSDREVRDRPLADIVEQLIGRNLALEVSETVRSSQENSIPVEIKKREFLLILKPLLMAGAAEPEFYAAYWRRVAGASLTAADGEMHQALLRAKRRIRDLSRDDPVTGLLTESAFREVLAHDWAVAQRERSCLSLICFSLDDFEAYLEVFGRHASDSCLRRVAQAIRRCLRRASDVAARINTPDGDLLVVLSHASEEAGVREFAERIAAAVRELGLHHPRSQVSRFVTVSSRTAVADAQDDQLKVEKLFNQLLRRTG